MALIMIIHGRELDLGGDVFGDGATTTVHSPLLIHRRGMGDAKEHLSSTGGKGISQPTLTLTQCAAISKASLQQCTASNDFSYELRQKVTVGRELQLFLQQGIYPTKVLSIRTDNHPPP